MAIYHLSIKAISRSAGRSVVAASAYRSGVELTDERQGLTHDYTCKHGVEDAFIVAPDGAEWARDRSRLWNAAARRELAREFTEELVRRYGVTADVAIHAPGREGDNRNHHAHILTTTRTVGADGMGVKTRVLDVAATASAEIEQVREVWGKQVNAALERHQVEQRVDHRSFARQGIEREPTIHMGVAATSMERQAAREIPGRDPVTDLGQRNEQIRERNLVLEAARTAMEVAWEAFEGLGKRARLAVGLARKLGERAEKEREAERQRKELARQAEVKRQQEERDRQRQLAREIEEPTFRRSRGLSRRRGRGRNPGARYGIVPASSSSSESLKFVLS